MTIGYRMAGPGDIAALAQMRADMICGGPEFTDEFRARLRGSTAEYMERHLADGSFVALVAVCEGEIVATGALTFYALLPNELCPGGKSAYLGNMYTVPAFRRQGIAQRLLELLMEEAVSAGCERVMLHATDAGRPLYERYGFVPSTISMTYFPGGMDGTGEI